jgi:hypothetical protein
LPAILLSLHATDALQEHTYLNVAAALPLLPPPITTPPRQFSRVPQSLTALPLHCHHNVLRPLPQLAAGMCSYLLVRTGHFADFGLFRVVGSVGVAGGSSSMV